MGVIFQIFDESGNNALVWSESEGRIPNAHEKKAIGWSGSRSLLRTPLKHVFEFLKAKFARTHRKQCPDHPPHLLPEESRSDEIEDENFLPPHVRVRDFSHGGLTALVFAEVPEIVPAQKNLNSAPSG
jgi:hypothetical protein